MTWKETACQLRCSQVSTTSQEAFFKIMVFGLSVLSLQFGMCFKHSVPDCHCQSTSSGTSSLAQRLSQITVSQLHNKISEQKNSDFKQKKSENNEKIQNNFRKSVGWTLHIAASFLEWMGLQQTVCKLFIYWYQNFFILQTPVLKALENTLLAISETFSQDWKFPSCKKHFLFLKDRIFLKLSVEKLSGAFYSLLGRRHLTRKTCLSITLTIKQLDAAKR